MAVGLDSPFLSKLMFRLRSCCLPTVCLPVEASFRLRSAVSSAAQRSWCLRVDGRASSLPGVAIRAL